MEKTTLEVIAPNVEEAVERGVEQLGVPRDAVDVEILDSGTTGFLGIGSRQARVRLTVNLSQPVSIDTEKAVKIEPSPEKSTEIKEVKTQNPANSLQSMEKGSALEIALTVVRELLDKMRVRANVSARIESPSESDEQPLILVEIQGDDLSILIGRRSETLNALQYITSMIVSKETGHWANLMIDVQGYRTRRERQLRRLAVRLAEQAINTGRRQVLEPMPANERRIIHLELSSYPNIVTESIGEEPNRKITIYVKK